MSEDKGQRDRKRCRHKQTCGRKRGYPDERSAKGALLHFAKETGANPVRFGAYRCTACSKWHYGHRVGLR